MSPAAKRAGLDWGKLAPLRIRARVVAEGVYAGAHRSARRGAGIEFGGHREYSPGDDLRWLDLRALLLHDRLMVRQFETETDRALRVVIDASASMGYAGTRAPGAKLAYAGLLAAALARLATTGGDPIGMTFLGGAQKARSLPVSGGREAFERAVEVLETLEPGGDLSGDPEALTGALGGIARGARRGTVLVVLSDLLDLPPDAKEVLGALALAGRILVVARILDPDERDLPFSGTVRLRSLEGGFEVETDADATRAAYVEALETERAEWDRAMTARGGRLVDLTTDLDPVVAVQRILAAMR